MEKYPTHNPPPIRISLFWLTFKLYWYSLVLYHDPVSSCMQVITLRQLLLWPCVHLVCLCQYWSYPATEAKIHYTLSLDHHPIKLWFLLLWFCNARCTMVQGVPKKATSSLLLEPQYTGSIISNRRFVCLEIVFWSFLTTTKGNLPILLSNFFPLRGRGSTPPPLKQVFSVQNFLAFFWTILWENFSMTFG